MQAQALRFRVTGYRLRVAGSGFKVWDLGVIYIWYTDQDPGLIV